MEHLIWDTKPQFVRADSDGNSDNISWIPEVETHHLTVIVAFEETKKAFDLSSG